MKACALFSVVLLACFILFPSSCKKPVTGSTLTLQLNAKYGTQNFALNAANVDPQGRYIIMSALQFYLSHIYLIKTDSTKVKVSDIALFDFSNPSSLSVSIKNVEGNFTGISFVCGLDSLTNDTTNPNNYSPPNPLSGDYNTYWLAWNSYRFEVMEGKWDTAVMPIMHYGIVYHIGRNLAYRQTQINKSFSVCCGTPYTLNLNLDVEKIFYNTSTNETLDIATEGSTSSMPTDNPVILTTFADNFSTAFSY